MSDTAEMPLVELIKTLPGYDPYKDSEGYYFDEAAAAHAIKWIQGACTFTKGKLFAGKPFILEWWQKAIIALVFGWKSTEDGSRRYREIFIYVPRKNGKTELMAAINLYVMFCDQEAGAEIYSAASTEDQASIVWTVSALMINNRQFLLDNSKVFTKSIVHDLTDGFYKYIAANEQAMHGKNAHCATVDELHACRRDVVEVIETSQGTRWQPLLFYTTTADFDRPSICNEIHNRACQVRDGETLDAEFLPVIFEATKDDDWHSEETWKKANPNYGVSLQKRYFMRKYKKACSTPSFQNTFKRLHLNMKTEQSERWIDLGLWDKCGNREGEDFTGSLKDLEQFRGRPCIAGLDLADTIDTASLSLLFPEDGFKIITHVWIPEDTAEEKEKTDKVPYREWADAGLVTLTPGNRIDYSYIKKTAIEVCEVVDMKHIGFDPYNATQLSIDLKENEGLPMEMVRQGFLTMNEPCKKIEADMAKGILNHGDNPVLRVHAANVMVKKDASGCIKIDKEKSSQKVDAVAALADAYACHVADLDDESIYNDHGIRSLGGDDEDDEDFRGWDDEDE